MFIDYSLIVQLLHLIFLVPLIIISAKMGFWEFVYVRTFIRFQIIVSSLIVLKIAIAVPITRIFLNILKPILLVIPMVLVAVLLNYFAKSHLEDFIAIFISGVVYMITFLIFAKNEMVFIYSEIKTESNVEKNSKLKDLT